MIEHEWKPERIIAREGRVLIDGPANTVLSVAPKAAEALAERIRAAAVEAKEQS